MEWHDEKKVDTRPNQESVTTIPTGGRLEGGLLRAALSKKAALISCIPLAAAALLMTGALCLVLAAGGQGADQAAAAQQASYLIFDYLHILLFVFEILHFPYL